MTMETPIFWDIAKLMKPFVPAVSEFLTHKKAPWQGQDSVVALWWRVFCAESAGHIFLRAITSAVVVAIWGTPKSWMFMGFALINHYKPTIWGYPHLWKPQYVGFRTGEKFAMGETSQASGLRSCSSGRADRRPRRGLETTVVARLEYLKR